MLSRLLSVFFFLFSAFGPVFADNMPPTSMEDDDDEDDYDEDEDVIILEEDVDYEEPRN